MAKYSVFYDTATGSIISIMDPPTPWILMSEHDVVISDNTMTFPESASAPKTADIFQIDGDLREHLTTPGTWEDLVDEEESPTGKSSCISAHRLSARVQGNRTLRAVRLGEVSKHTDTQLAALISEIETATGIYTIAAIRIDVGTGDRPNEAAHYVDTSDGNKLKVRGLFTYE